MGTEAWICLMRDGSGIRDGSDTVMQEAPADSAILAWSTVVTWMIAPPVSCWASLTLVEKGFGSVLVRLETVVV
ncbi:hypothetical protein HanRHA438_Chr09g0427621 [Helianthus annuus]|nr:hypothetical protein HanRHA438_Chr09g0427621 [Helianthus annuus]